MFLINTNTAWKHKIHSMTDKQCVIQQNMKAADRLSCVTYTIAGQWGKLTGQPHGLVLMLRNRLTQLS